jgi:hypothetical protein
MPKIRGLSFSQIRGWGSLVKNSETASFFQTKSWLSLWKKHFKVKDFYLGVFNGDELVGLAALGIKKGRLDFLGLSEVLNGELVTDYGDVLIKPGFEDKFWELVLDYLAQNYSKAKVSFSFLREDSPSFTVLKKLGADLKKQEVAPFINLPFSWQAYLSLLERKKRHEIQRKKRRLNKTNWEVLWFTKVGAGEAKDFLSLMEASSKAKKTFLSSEIKDFFKDLLLNFSEKQKLLGFLKIEGELAASMFGFKFGKNFLLYNSGFNPELAKYSPGFLLTVFLIKKAIEDKKIERFDFLRGGERYKFDLGARKRYLFKAELKNN